MKKRTLITLGVIAAIIITITGSYLNAKYLNPNQVKVTNITITDSSIPSSFDNFKILFISDIEFGSYFNEERMDNFFEDLYSLNADMVIFGGDLIDENYSYVTDEISYLTEKLSAIEAPYGKFAILGDFDLTSQQRSALITKVLNDANFEMLQDNLITLYHDTNEPIYLLGFDYSEEAIDTSSITVDTYSYIITVLHGAGQVANLPVSLSDLTLSGHSHHLQINLPFLEDDSFKMTGTYKLGKTTLTNSILYVTNGVGTTNINYRLFSDPEIVLITLQCE